VAPQIRASSNNTNLEDISDWLTKTLVGVGLTQLYSVPHALWTASGRLNQSGFAWSSAACTPSDCAGPGQLLALALIFYFGPGGFWLGYIATRTFVTMWFEDIDRMPFSAQDVAAAADVNALQLDPSGKKFVEPEPDVRSADAALSNVPLAKMATAAESAAWGAAQARSGNLSEALTALKKADALAQGSDPNIRKQLASVYLALDRPNDAAALIPTNLESPLAMLNALYEPPPRGYGEAIRIGEALLQRPEMQNNASVHSWLAAGYGQKYAAQQQANVSSSELDETRRKVIDQVTAALHLDPTTKNFLRSLWKPAPTSLDNDLSALPPDDPDLHRLLD
jgi:hypothetical protein